MLFWFVGGAATIVWLVFRDVRFDFRLLTVGALVPDLVDAVLGGARVLHAVVAPIAALALVMGVTAGRKPVRRRLLALPIGMFLHLVLDGVFRDTRVFWWPFSGLALPDARLPSLTRGWWNVLLELVGIVLTLRMVAILRHEASGAAGGGQDGGPAGPGGDPAGPGRGGRGSVPTC